MTSPSVCVLMTVYHRDDVSHLSEAIRSVCTQSYENVRVFLGVDGQIKPDAWEVLDQLTESFNSLTVIPFAENRGLARTLNDLIDIISSLRIFDYVARMDADDISRVTRLEEQVLFMESHPEIHVCGTSCREFGASFALEEKHLPATHEQLINVSIYKCPFIHPSVMFRGSVFLEGVRYPTNTVLTEDMALWFLLLNQGYRFGNLQKVLLDYRLTEDTIMRRRGLSKGLSEFHTRIVNMWALGNVSLRNIMLVFARLVFHILPPALMKLAYANGRTTRVTHKAE